MGYFTKWAARAALLVAAMVVSAGVHAQATFVFDATGNTLIGANNINVQGSFFNVTFGDQDLTSAHQEYDIDFSIYASHAIASQIFGFIASNRPQWAVAGCSYSHICAVYTAHSGNSLIGAGLSYADFRYNPFENSGVFVGAQLDSGYPEGYRFFDTGNIPYATTALWTAVTAVPEPETYAMMLAGLGLIGAIARRRKAALTA